MAVRASGTLPDIPTGTLPTVLRQDRSCFLFGVGSDLTLDRTTLPVRATKQTYPACQHQATPIPLIDPFGLGWETMPQTLRVILGKRYFWQTYIARTTQINSA